VRGKKQARHEVGWRLQEAFKNVMQNPHVSFLQETVEEHSLPNVLRQSRIETDSQLDLMFLKEFNRELDRNAQLSRLNETYLDQRMDELDKHVPICGKVYELTRVRLHELLLLCAVNYANNCEYAAVGDLMFNPRLTLVHIRGRHESLVKERHSPLTEQFKNSLRTHAEVVAWLRDWTAVEIRKKPLIPHSYEILEKAAFVPGGYLDSAWKRASQIADLSAFLCCQGFRERLELDKWLGTASPSDRALMKSRLLPLEWRVFRDLGWLISSLFLSIL
jgi:hypothetical protein